MKYFFLTEGWTVGRVWAVDGLWNETAWRRQPNIDRMNLCIVEKGEQLWLYRVEDTILTVEVMQLPLDQTSSTAKNIGQVKLKRLITAEQVIERLSAAETICHLKNIQSVVQ